MVISKEGKSLTYRTWHQVLEKVLISQGLAGARETAILKYLPDVHEDEVIGYLELLLKEDKVQKFKYTRHIYWRATNNILDK